VPPDSDVGDREAARKRFLESASMAAVLMPDLPREVRALRVEGLKYRAIAGQMGISIPSVAGILKGK
jgi:hypothetical protein